MIFSQKITEEPVQYCIPNYADLLVFQATYEGQYAFRAVSIVNEMSNHRHTGIVIKLHLIFYVILDLNDLLAIAN